MAITGISAIGNQQIIAAGAQSATKAYQDSNGGVITSKYQTTANMSNYQTTAGMSDYATTASVTGKQDTLTFGYTNDQISQINGSAIYSQGGGTGVVTSTAGDGTYVTAINETPLSGAGGTQLVTSIHTAEYGVMAGTSATAVDRINGLGLFAQSGWSAVNAGWAKSAVSAYKDGNGRVITNTYQTTDGMTAYPNSADVTGTAQYGLTTGGWTEITGGGGGGYTGNVQEALDEVYSNSGNWNSVYNHVSTASAGWTGGGGGGSTDVTLWEASDSGQKSGVFELSDSLTNYKRYGIYYYLAGYRGCLAGGYSELVYRPEWSGFTLMGNDTTANNDGSSAIFKGYSYGSATNNTINILSSVTLYSTNLTAQPSNLRTGKSAGLVITKIVGIN